MNNWSNKSLLDLPGPIMITGHTGFKGTWMSLLLQQLGVAVVGYSLKPEVNSLFSQSKLSGRIPEMFADIRDYKKLEGFTNKHRPSVIVHMAAQPLVLKSYESPRETFDVNVMGTANLLDISSKMEFIKAVVVVTTDKVYKNFEANLAFCETDKLEGRDPYSASKVATEAVVTAWREVCQTRSGTKITSVRAGNVIGGGDLSDNRIIPDIIRSIQTSKNLIIRNPDSARPWQHVLDVIFGYTLLITKMIDNHEFTSVNFGPKESNNLKVSEIVAIAKQYFPMLRISEENIVQNGTDNLYEARSLKLNSSYAKKVLGWESTLDQEMAVKMTFDWWADVLKTKNPLDRVILDISNYLNLKNSD